MDFCRVVVVMLLLKALAKWFGTIIEWIQTTFTETLRHHYISPFSTLISIPIGKLLFWRIDLISARNASKYPFAWGGWGWKVHLNSTRRYKLLPFSQFSAQFSLSQFSHPGKNMGGSAWKCSPANGKLAYISGQASNSLNQLNLYWEVDAWDSSCLGVVHILRNHFWGSKRPPHPCNTVIILPYLSM